MLEKDEVSKYTVHKDQVNMLEWPPYSQKYTAKDIPNLIKKSFKPMTDSNAVPNPVPGTEVTQSPGLIPETTTQIPGYDPTTGTAPGEYDPTSANVDTAVPTSEQQVDAEQKAYAEATANSTGYPQPGDTPYNSPSTYVENDGTTGPVATPPSDYAAAVDHQVNSMPSAPPDTHQKLMEDPAYAVHVHEQQLNRICDMLEEVCSRVVAIEDKLNGMEQEMHFSHDPNDPLNDYPEVNPPTQTT